MSKEEQQSDAGGDNSAAPAADAQRLLVRLWRERQAVRASGRMPQRIVLSMQNYKLLQSYHALLGELPNPNIDYITRYTVFDLPVYIDDSSDCTVE